MTRRLLLAAALVFTTSACNLGQITDSSGTDGVSSTIGIGSGWLGGQAARGRARIAQGGRARQRDAYAESRVPRV